MSSDHPGPKLQSVYGQLTDNTLHNNLHKLTLPGPPLHGHSLIQGMRRIPMKKLFVFKVGFYLFVCITLLVFWGDVPLKSDISVKEMRQHGKTVHGLPASDNEYDTGNKQPNEQHFERNKQSPNIHSQQPEKIKDKQPENIQDTQPPMNQDPPHHNNNKDGKQNASTKDTSKKEVTFNRKSLQSTKIEVERAQDEELTPSGKRNQIEQISTIRGNTIKKKEPVRVDKVDTNSNDQLKRQRRGNESVFTLESVGKQLQTFAGSHCPKGLEWPVIPFHPSANSIHNQANDLNDNLNDNNSGQDNRKSNKSNRFVTKRIHSRRMQIKYMSSPDILKGGNSNPNNHTNINTHSKQHDTHNRMQIKDNSSSDILKDRNSNPNNHTNVNTNSEQSDIGDQMQIKDNSSPDILKDPNANPNNHTNINTNSKQQRDAQDRDCTSPQFSPIPLPKTALASFPGCGNTWTRELIEQLTGVLTGSEELYDLEMTRAFQGEGVQDARVIMIKTHWPYNSYGPSEPEKNYTRTILVVRSPQDCILSTFNHRFSNNHTGLAAEWQFKDDIWARYVPVLAQMWFLFYERWLQKDTCLLVVYFQRLKTDLQRELRQMATFLGVKGKFVEENIKCILKLPGGKFKRKRKISLDVYTREQKILLEWYGKRLADLMAKKAHFRPVFEWR